MSYKIINKVGRSLTAFHSNDGWSIGGVFPCSFKSYVIFKTKKEAKDYLEYMLKESEKQRDRWKEWTDIAIKFIKTLEIYKD